MRYKETVVSSEVITVPELQRLVGTDRICLLDARDPEAYEHGHIPGAVNLHPSRLEHSVLLNWGEEVPDQLRAIEDVTASLRAAGVSNDATVCVYDEGGDFLASRLWWALDVTGHQRHRLLDGGFSTWLRDVQAVSIEHPSPAPGGFVPSRTDQRRLGFCDVITAIDSPRMIMCNTLPFESYLQATIPGSVSFPYTETYADDNPPLLRSRHELAASFLTRGVSAQHHLVCFCRLGYSASQLYFAARYAGFPHVSLYDGGMVDWSARGGELVPGAG